MKPREQQLLAVIREVRTCFNQLKTLAEGLHRDLGVNPSMRAVMEALAADGPQTVPDIARHRGVSRQHIQAIVNALDAGGWIEVRDNPAHRRSVLVALTPLGESTFDSVLEREKAPIGRLAGSMTLDELAQTRTVLSRINHQLEIEIEKGETHEKTT